MPNWCEGNIRFRGKASNIISLLLYEIESLELAQGKNENIELLVNHEIQSTAKLENGYFHLNKAKDTCLDEFYIRRTRRNFIEDCDIEFEYDNPDDIVCVCQPGFKAAWGVDSEPYVSMSKKYGVDIRINAYEKGMQFAQEIEIINGELKRDEEIKYDDWDWECPMPCMGG